MEEAKKKTKTDIIKDILCLKKATLSPEKEYMTDKPIKDKEKAIKKVTQSIFFKKLPFRNILLF